MRLSFVIPTYNEEAYLRACLESILLQKACLTLSTEIMVVNTANTDGTREVAVSVPGVTVVDEPRKGLTYARQAGFNASTGDIIANDADSRLTTKWVLQVLAVSNTEPDVIALSGPKSHSRWFSAVSTCGIA